MDELILESEDGDSLTLSHVRQPIKYSSSLDRAKDGDEPLAYQVKVIALLKNEKKTGLGFGGQERTILKQIKLLDDLYKNKEVLMLTYASLNELGIFKVEITNLDFEENYGYIQVVIDLEQKIPFAVKKKQREASKIKNQEEAAKAAKAKESQSEEEKGYLDQILKEFDSYLAEIWGDYAK